MRRARNALLWAAAQRGHPGVARWVASHASSVLAYFPMSDAAPSGVMRDQSGNGRDGTYGSAMAAGQIDGQDVADFTGNINSHAVVADAVWMNQIAGIFAVVEFDSFADNPVIVARDSSTLDRLWQFRCSTAGVLQLLQVTTGNPTRTGPTLSPGSRNAVGVGFYGGTMQFVVGGAAITEGGGAPIFETGACALQFGKNEFTTPDNQFLNGRLGSVVLLSNASDQMFVELHRAWLG